MTTCKTCAHPKRAAIDLAIANGGSSRNVGATFGVNFHSIARHARNCVPAVAQKAVAERKAEGQAVVGVGELLARMQTLYERSVLLLDMSLASEQPSKSARVVKEVRENLVVMGRLLGAFPRETKSSTTNIDNRTQVLALKDMTLAELQDLTKALKPKLVTEAPRG